MMSGFKVSIGENPYLPWEKMHPSYQEMVLGWVDRVHEGSTPEDVHIYWMEWAKIHKPEHNSIIPFENMSLTEQIKDDIIVVLSNMFKKYL